MGGTGGRTTTVGISWSEWDEGNDRYSWGNLHMFLLLHCSVYQIMFCVRVYSGGCLGKFKLKPMGWKMDCKNVVVALTHPFIMGFFTR